MMEQHITRVSEAREEAVGKGLRSWPVGGAGSLPLLRGIVRIAADAIPGSQFVELAGAEHETYFDQPAEFAAAVRSFAERLEVTGV